MSAWRCDLCGGSRSESFSSWIVRCVQCGLVVTCPIPDPQELQERYGGDYYAGWDGSGVRERLWRRRLAIVQSHLRPCRILDVGCGAGEFVRAARGAGFEAEGTEFSAAARAMIKDFPVYPGPSGSPGGYDGITLWHVLEHTPSPKDMLEQVHARLGPGGVLFIAVPNVKSYWFNGVYRLVKGKWPELYTPETKEPHLFHFSAQTLRKYLESSGFKVKFESCDVPDTNPYYRLADWPARAFFRSSGINWTTTLLAISTKA